MLPDILFMNEAHLTYDGINTTQGIFTVADGKIHMKQYKVIFNRSCGRYKVWSTRNVPTKTKFY
jgi:hypothetical protein